MNILLRAVKQRKTISFFCDCKKTVAFLQFHIKVFMQSQLIDSKQHSRFCKTDLVTLPSLKISIPQLCLPENSCITEWGCNAFPCNIEEMCQVCTKKEHGVLSLFPSECTYPKGNCQLVQCSARTTFCVCRMNSTAFHVYRLSLLYRQR